MPTLPFRLEALEAEAAQHQEALLQLLEEEPSSGTSRGGRSRKGRKKLPREPTPGGEGKGDGKGEAGRQGGALQAAEKGDCVEEDAEGCVDEQGTGAAHHNGKGGDGSVGDGVQVGLQGCSEAPDCVRGDFVDMSSGGAGAFGAGDDAWQVSAVVCGK